MSYLILKWLHVLSSTVLFGTGLGTAYYMFFASRTRDPRIIASVFGYGVVADWLFTTTTIIFQPLSGWYLTRMAGVPLNTQWVAWSIALYVLATVCWLPVVWIQLRMRATAKRALDEGTPLPAVYSRYLLAWVLLGILAFLALLGVLYLMVVKPR